MDGYPAALGACPLGSSRHRVNRGSGMRLIELVARDRGGQIMLAVLLVVTLAVPILNLAVPDGHALHVSTYTVTLLGKYLTYALLAVAVDLVWGYLGILSLGHAAFFALGGYAMGMYLMRQIGERGVYGDPVLPDFMVFLNWKELPWFWWGFDQFWFAMLMVVPGPRAPGLGLRLARLPLPGHRGLPVHHHPGPDLCPDARLLPQRDGLRRQQRPHRLQGPAGLQPPGGRAPASGSSSPRPWPWRLGYLACRAIVTSRLGRVAVAIRDAEGRTRFIGYRVEHVKLAIFTFSAVLAGIAGALYVPQVGIINPGEFSPLNSIEVVIWVAVGGRATLYGAVVGAVLVNYGKTYLTGAMPDAWLFALGGLFVLVTLFLPRGVTGLLGKGRAV